MADKAPILIFAEEEVIYGRNGLLRMRQEEAALEDIWPLSIYCK
jgi:hypothetical protein